MSITQIRLRYHQFLRAFEIVRILLGFALREFISKTWLAYLLFSRKKIKENRTRSTEERLRMAIEHLGPTFIKFGQILADRPDFISEKLRMELKKLQDHAKPLNDEIAISIIENQLGGPISDFFSLFDRKHLASASIGQVYKGVLKSGEKVIVKVQRPNIESKIKLDLVLLDYFALQLQKNYPELKSLDLNGIVEEFGRTILLELNYMNEASNLMRFREMFRDNPHVYIPSVHLEMSTRRILIMEYIEGISPDRIEELEANGNDLKEIARHGTTMILDMIFKHGFFHADPHPGNIFIRPVNVICLIDFGMVGTLSAAHMQFLGSFAIGFARMSPHEITNSLLELCGKKHYDRREDLEFEIEKILKRNSYTPFDKLDFAQILNDCMAVIIQHGLKIPSSILLLIKALATIEKFAAKLHPDVNLIEILMPYARELVLRKFSIKRLAGMLYDTVGSYVSLFRDFPKDISRILYKAQEGRINFDIGVKDGNNFARIVKQLSQRVTLAILLAAMLLGSSILTIWGQTNAGDIFFGISATICSLLLLRFLLIPR